ncbi:hypothetical protein MUO71_06890, partial [Candidatus Bathyarchaeota archaeon]|nr:hypothetical protein [Candidatus Bathyarchaeota archaeon]
GPSPILGSDRGAAARWKGISLDGLHEINREEIQRLLVKVEADGAPSLTQAERDFLNLRLNLHLKRL